VSLDAPGSLQVVLVAPEIAANTGNIVRLCANVGASLHLVRPLGFVLDDARLRRAGLDYHELVDMHVHDSWAAYLSSSDAHQSRRFAFSSRATRRFDRVDYRAGDVFVFGSERAGLDAATLADFDAAHTLGIPMRAGNRSLNLANAAAIVLYEAWRRLDFAGATGAGATSETLDALPFDR
jgi:tRNA (cytidine/uridine-2'-O-)-methyltransferase